MQRLLADRTDTPPLHRNSPGIQQGMTCGGCLGSDSARSRGGLDAVAVGDVAMCAIGVGCLGPHSGRNVHLHTGSETHQKRIHRS